jgi:hypothetical protein
MHPVLTFAPYLRVVFRVRNSRTVTPGGAVLVLPERAMSGRAENVIVPVRTGKGDCCDVPGGRLIAQLSGTRGPKDRAIGPTRLVHFGTVESSRGTGL